MDGTKKPISQTIAPTQALLALRSDLSLVSTGPHHFAIALKRNGEQFKLKLSPLDADVIRALDGRRSATDVSEHFGRFGKPVTPNRILDLYRELVALELVGNSTPSPRITLSGAPLGPAKKSASNSVPPPPVIASAEKSQANLREPSLRNVEGPSKTGPRVLTPKSGATKTGLAARNDRSGTTSDVAEPPPPAPIKPRTVTTMGATPAKSAGPSKVAANASPRAGSPSASPLEKANSEKSAPIAKAMTPAPTPVRSQNPSLPVPAGSPAVPEDRGASGIRMVSPGAMASLIASGNSSAGRSGNLSEAPTVLPGPPIKNLGAQSSPAISAPSVSRVKAPAPLGKRQHVEEEEVATTIRDDIGAMFDKPRASSQISEPGEQELPDLTNLPKRKTLAPRAETDQEWQPPTVLDAEYANDPEEALDRHQRPTWAPNAQQLAQMDEYAADPHEKVTWAPPPGELAAYAQSIDRHQRPTWIPTADELQNQIVQQNQVQTHLRSRANLPPPAIQKPSQPAKRFLTAAGTPNAAPAPSPNVLEAVLEKNALEKKRQKPENRGRSSFVPGEVVFARTVPRASATEPGYTAAANRQDATQPTTPPLFEEPQASAKKPPTRMILAGVAAFVLLGGLGWVLLRPNSSSKPASAVLAPNQNVSAVSPTPSAAVAPNPTTASTPPSNAVVPTPPVPQDVPSVNGAARGPDAGAEPDNAAVPPTKPDAGVLAPAVEPTQAAEEAIVVSFINLETSLDRVTASSTGLVTKVAAGGSVERGESLFAIRVGPVALNNAPKDVASLKKRVRELEELARKDDVYRDFLERAQKDLAAAEKPVTPKEQSVKAPRRGDFTAKVRNGETVKAGQVLGFISDPQQILFKAAAASVPGPFTCEVVLEEQVVSKSCRIANQKKLEGSATLTTQAKPRSKLKLRLTPGS